MKKTLEEQRKEAKGLFEKGDFIGAITIQIKVLNQTIDKPQVSDRYQVIYSLWALQDYRAIITILESSLEIWPEDYNLLKNMGTLYNKTEEYSKADFYLQKALLINSDDPMLYDSFTSNYYKQGLLDKAIEYGEKSLLLKDSQCIETPIKLNNIQSKDNQEMTNIISFSLWGHDERYLNSALKNVELSPFIYPGWVCRFYCDETVPESTRGQLLAAGAELVMMPSQEHLYEGLFWRFLVVNDPQVNRFLVRDADSVITIRERLAVDEWIESGKEFHLMRDYYSHTDLILAGMWGGKAGVLPALNNYWNDYLFSESKTANCDQHFLKEKVWPAIRNNCLIHDDYFNVLGAKKFPFNSKLSNNMHVGIDYSVIKNNIGLIKTSNKEKTWQLRNKIIFTITTGRSGTVYLSKLLKDNIEQAEVYHERMSYTENGKLNPDLSHFTNFNTLGNIKLVENFWKNKLAAIRYGKLPIYAEVSHYLSKAGLYENIDYIPDEVDIDIVCLKRDTFDIAWSYANRFEFTNNGYTWLFALDPSYARNIVDYRPYKEYGALGACVWYVHEMNARTEYYKILLHNKSNVTFHDVNLSDIAKEKGATEFLNKIGFEVNSTSIIIPQKSNASSQRYFGDDVKEIIKTVISKTECDFKAVALEKIKERRLG